MKLKYLDIHNCHDLLPPQDGLPLLKRLDECLQGINDKHGALNGSIDALILHNKQTSNSKNGFNRLCNSPIDIAQNSDIISRVIHTTAIERSWPGPAHLHRIHVYENRIVWKTIVPLQFLLKRWGNANYGHQCYIHSISHNMKQIKDFSDFEAIRKADSDSYYYVGITGRNWLLRLSEHIGEMRRGSKKWFHKIMNESVHMTDVLISSSLRDINLSFEDAMNWEEHNVDKIAYGPNGLNMIPGGFKGLKLLHKLKITDRINITLDEREKAINEYIRQNPRKGLPNPFMSELWKDDNHYLKVIESRPKTLSTDQVRIIRELGKAGWTIKNITKEVGALNETQVINVISGKYYKRVL